MCFPHCGFLKYCHNDPGGREWMKMNKRTMTDAHVFHDVAVASQQHLNVLVRWYYNYTEKTNRNKDFWWAYRLVQVIEDLYLKDPEKWKYCVNRKYRRRRTDFWLRKHVQSCKMKAQLLRFGPPPYMSAPGALEFKHYGKDDQTRAYLHVDDDVVPDDFPVPKWKREQYCRPGQAAPKAG